MKRACGVALGLLAAIASGCETQASLTRKRTRDVENGLLRAVFLKGQRPEKLGLFERLRFYKAPAVSIAVMDRYALEWAKAYGLQDVLTGQPASVDTVFQAGAVGQALAAAAALRLAADGRLGLDQDVRPRLGGREFPEGAFGPEGRLTLRGLLGRTDDYGILPEVLEAASGSSFPEYMAESILAPLGLRTSTFEAAPPAELKALAAAGHGREGGPIKEEPPGEPSATAPVFWTNPSALVAFMADVLATAMGRPGRLLDAASAQAMLTPQAGTRTYGFAVEGSGTDVRINLRGRAEGFSCALDVYPYRGQGAVVMTNSANGFLLTDEINRALAAVYGWPDFKPQEKALYRLDPSAYAPYVGRYEITPDYVLDVSHEDYYLVIRPSGQAPTKFYVESQTFFFSVDPYIRIQFLTGAGGGVTGLILWQQDFKQEARKVG